MAITKVIDARKKLKLLQQHGFPQVVCDIVKLCDTMLLEAEEGTDEEYGRVAQNVIYKLRGLYKSQITTQQVTVQTKDIENLILAIKTGEEPEWKNKTT